ncbi:MAG: FKBP-type peptidyl-prolyl cis-trans isomerase [Solirubrobacteraceae bacterium]
MTYFKISPSTIRSRATLAAAALGATILIAGCGSSGGSSTITVGNENSADNALIKAGESTSSTTSTKCPSGTPTPCALAATTPTSGPLSKEPTVTVPSGPAPSTLETKDLIVGKGTEAQAGATVTVNYVGVLYKNGKVFDASWLRHEPSTFSLKSVIPGWTKGIPGMRVGGRRELVIPAALAYGAKGSPPTIPPNEPLVFVVDLLGA